MTLCIAAHAHLDGKPCIVLCSDWKVEEDFAGSETADKQGVLLPGWFALQSGTSARAVELSHVYRDYLIANPLKPRKILSALKEPANIHRRNVMNEYVEAQIGRSYEWLLKEGQKALPADYFSQILHSVEALKLEAQLLICGFVKSQELPPAPVICVVNDTGNLPYVRLAENFASVGSGSIVADSVLHRREHQSDMPLKKALYHVIEAKRLGEIASGVGSLTTIGVLDSDGRYRHVSLVGESFLEECYLKYAPKDLEDSEDWDSLPADFLGSEFPTDVCPLQ